MDEVTEATEATAQDTCNATVQYTQDDEVTKPIPGRFTAFTDSRVNTDNELFATEIPTYTARPHTPGSGYAVENCSCDGCSEIRANLGLDMRRWLKMWQERPKPYPTSETLECMEKPIWDLYSRSRAGVMGKYDGDQRELKGKR